MIAEGRNSAAGILLVKSIGDTRKHTWEKSKKKKKIETKYNNERSNLT